MIAVVLLCTAQSKQALPAAASRLKVLQECTFLNKLLSVLPPIALDVHKPSITNEKVLEGASPDKTDS